MNGHREDELVILPVEVVEMVLLMVSSVHAPENVTAYPPDVFDVPRVHKAMAVWHLLHEHHRWEIINVPVCRYLDQAGFLTLDQRLHPVLCLFLIINLRPGVASTKIVWLAIFVTHRVIVFNAIRE
jgi:hypothetical protein